MWVGRRQRDAKDYFVADREIPWWAVMFSIVASETSALTFISIPGLAYVGNLGFLEIAIGLSRSAASSSRTRCCRATTRAISSRRTRCSRSGSGSATRRFTSIVFMVTRGMADSVRVFATAVPIALIIGPLLPHAAVMPVAVLVLGTLTMLYTIRGGMRAVVWTEIVQASVYIIGGIVGGRPRRPSRRPADGARSSPAASAAGKLKIISWYTGFDQPHTMFAGIDRRRVSLDGVARRRSAHRAATALGDDRSRDAQARSSAAASR